MDTELHEMKGANVPFTSIGQLLRKRLLHLKRLEKESPVEEWLGSQEIMGML